MMASGCARLQTSLKVSVQASTLPLERPVTRQFAKKQQENASKLQATSCCTVYSSRQAQLRRRCKERTAATIKQQPTETAPHDNTAERRPRLLNPEIRVYIQRKSKGTASY